MSELSLGMLECTINGVFIFCWHVVPQGLSYLVDDPLLSVRTSTIKVSVF